jgi:hypothetical protein
MGVGPYPKGGTMSDYGTKKLDELIKRIEGMSNEEYDLLCIRAYRDVWDSLPLADQSFLLSLLEQAKKLRKVCKQENCYECPGNEWKDQGLIKCTGTLPVEPGDVEVRLK